jgi:hypothetical protein
MEEAFKVERKRRGSFMVPLDPQISFNNIQINQNVNDSKGKDTHAQVNS